ncbi:CDP-diacylglycerol---glycerol-3-phosphate 1-phosphatidyltransferase [Powellomyces hirtus]|uniref:CDP-diacylglycerol--glycerol-3-phosphate 3-phosphatidyltransferase n=1 Tax=Powellomyces hirtus TaxID=109895 RepID=A0A507E8U3_9FUNG|nr:CDP-diacylglycerol---glycerol-3-phosphate 1-phosphatidyltransferase [Powellomyces hirtus]
MASLKRLGLSPLRHLRTTLPIHSPRNLHRRLTPAHHLPLPRSYSHTPTSSSQLTQTFAPVITQTPVFSADPAQITILDLPADFYKAIEEGIRTAKKRIVLASLYLGAGEGRVATALHAALTRNPALRVHILLDYFRGTRGSTNSITLLSPLLAAFPTRVTLSLYHTPAVGAVIKRIVPPRFIEGFGLQHMKVYAFDGDVILSGANLNTDYFVNRQDRYIRFGDAPGLADYYSDLVHTVAGVSYTVQSPTELVPPCAHPSDPARLDTKTLRIRAAAAVGAFTQRWFDATAPLRTAVLDAREATTSSTRIPDTLVLPVVQMAQLGITQEQGILTTLLTTLGSTRTSPRWNIALSSGYLNFPAAILNLILDSRARFAILTAAPQANGFFGSKGVSRHLPAAYTHLEKKLLRLATHSGRAEAVTVNEWRKDAWTFHAKGLWCTPPADTEPVLTVIGSSNFGYRSLYRDVEAQAVVVTSNPALRAKMQKNLDMLWSHSHPVTRHHLETDPERTVHPGVALATRVIRSML